MDERENYKNLPVQDKRECNMEKISETEPLAMEDLANDKKESHPDYSESVNDCANNGQVILFYMPLFYVVNVHILKNFIVLLVKARRNIFPLYENKCSSFNDV